MKDRDILFISYADAKDLLSIPEALAICEDALRQQARGSVVWSQPPSLKLDVAAPLHNHWQIKGATLTEPQISGVRLYNYIDDGIRNNVGSLERLGFVLLSNAATAEPLAIIDDHWNYALRSIVSPSVLLKWVAPSQPKILALVGVGMMGEHAIRCLTSLFRFDEIRCISRSKGSRERFASRWEKALGVRVSPCDTIYDTVSCADIVIGGTTSTEVMCREQWLKAGCVFISLARRELDPAGWRRMDKVIVDSWDFNVRNPVFREMVDLGQFSREELHAEFHEVVSGIKPGRTNVRERILLHTCGLASQDVAIAHHVYLRAVKANKGIRVPSAY